MAVPPSVFINTLDHVQSLLEVRKGERYNNLLGFRLVHLNFTPCIRLFAISIIPLYVLRQ